MDIKIHIKALGEQSPSAPQKTPKETVEEKLKALLERVEYAVDCIRADYKKQEAIKFLQELAPKLEKLNYPREEHRIALEKIKPVLSNFGTVHEASED